MMRSLLLSLALCAATGLHAQIGGLFTYEFLNFAPSARVAALGGAQIAVLDDDVNLAALNPAVLNPLMHQQLSFSHAFHLGGIQYGYASGAVHHQRWATTFYGGLQYVGYGDFDQTNDLGEVEGSFKAAEYALVVGAGRELGDRFHGGVNLRLVSSQLESYASYGLVADAGLTYLDTAHNLTVSVVARNAGTQLSTYRKGNREPLPFEMQVGVSKRLNHLPFRFSVIYRYLDRWNVTYDDPNTTETAILFGDAPTERSDASVWLDNLARHLVFNGELYIGTKDNFRLRLGYNHLMRKELSLSEYRTLAGFTFGAGIKINRFRIDYGRGNYHLVGGINQLTIGTNIREFK